MSNKGQFLSTSVTASFSSGGEAHVILEESKFPPVVPNKDAPGSDCVKFFCLFTDIPVDLRTTSGSVYCAQQGLTKAAEDIITFNNSMTAGLRYPGATLVTFSVLGGLLGADGQAGISLNFDTTRNVLVASKLCYGSVRIRYRAPYSMWGAKFDIIWDVPKPTGLPSLWPPKGVEDDPPTNLSPMVVLAFNIDPEPRVMASLSLSPPTEVADPNDPNDRGWLINRDSGTPLPQLRFEQDPDYTPRLLSFVTAGKPYAGTRVRVIPAVQPEMTMTTGQIVSWGEGGGNSVTQLLTFSGSSSVTLPYQPVGSISMAAQGVFVDMFGNRFTPQLVGPGGTVTVVDWQPEGTHTNPRIRPVANDEIVVTDAFNNAIGAYGVISVTFSYTYKVFDFVFDYDNTKNEFKTAYVAGTYNGQVANITLNPPSKKGIK